MTYIASTMLESATWKSFAFYMDLTDGTRKNPALRKSFGFPLLAQGASPTDDQAFLVPDTHMMAGVLWGSTYESTIPESLAGFAQRTCFLFFCCRHIGMYLVMTARVS